MKNEDNLSAIHTLSIIREQNTSVFIAIFVPCDQLRPMQTDPALLTNNTQQCCACCVRLHATTTML